MSCQNQSYQNRYTVRRTESSNVSKVSFKSSANPPVNYCINGECNLLLRSTGSTASRTGPTPACPAATCPGTASPASGTPATPWRTPASTPGGWTSPSPTSATTTPASTPTATAATRATRPPRSTRPVLDYWQVTTGAITRC